MLSVWNIPPLLTVFIICHLHSDCEKCFQWVFLIISVMVPWCLPKLKFKLPASPIGLSRTVRSASNWADSLKPEFSRKGDNQTVLGLLMGLFYGNDECDPSLAMPAVSSWCYEDLYLGTNFLKNKAIGYSFRDNSKIVLGTWDYS